MSRPTAVLRRLRRAVLARRRSLAAACATLAVAAALQANAAPAEPRTMLVTAARDLPSGVVVQAGDLSRTAFAPESVPDGAVAEASVAVGRTTAGPLRSGEPITDARLVTSSLLDGYPGLVAVPVRIGDPGAVRLLRVGDRVDVLAADPQGRSPATVVGRDVPVLALPSSEEDSPGLGTGALVVLALPASSARQVAAASVSSFLSVVLTR
ncbi:MAG TPA: SAF domain-containing protein [Nocardioidaceae bacterium]|nr:SAF domain-containing protein [Nocardioidaceae bacterium]